MGVPIRCVVRSPGGAEFAVYNLKAFCREHGLRASAMSQVKAGVRRHHRGWECRSLEQSWELWRSLVVPKPRSIDPNYLPREPGVYLVRCEPTGKVYVGSALDMYQRMHGHLCHLEKGNHHSLHLQRAWWKYGSKAFTWRVIEVVRDKDRRLLVEQHWLDKLKACDGRYGFNNHPQARSAEGVKRSEEYLAAMADRKSKDWIVTDLDGVEHAVHNLARFCAAHGLTHTCMVRTARGKQRSHRGWQCRPAGMTKKEWYRSIRPMRDARFLPKRWNVTSPQGRTFFVIGLCRFCKLNGLYATAMIRVARGEYSQHRGWKCAYAM